MRIERVTLIGLPAGAVAGFLASAELRFVALRKPAALLAGVIGGGVGVAVAARIAANSSDVGLAVPGGTEAAVSALVTGSIGGAALVAALGVVRALLAEG